MKLKIFINLIFNAQFLPFVCSLSSKDISYPESWDGWRKNILEVSPSAPGFVFQIFDFVLFKISVLFFTFLISWKTFLSLLIGFCLQNFIPGFTQLARWQNNGWKISKISTKWQKHSKMHKLRPYSPTSAAKSLK